MQGLPQGHEENQWQRWDLSPGCVPLEATLVVSNSSRAVQRSAGGPLEALSEWVAVVSLLLLPC